MRTRWLVAFACVALLSGGFALAAEVGNNPDRSGWRWDVGFDRSAREVESDGRALMYSYLEEWESSEDYYGYYSQNEWIDSFTGRETLDKYYLKGGYGFGDKYVFYVTLGMARMATETNDMIHTWEYEDYEYYFGEEYLYYDTDTELTQPTRGMGEWDPFYGAGFKAVFVDNGGFKVGMDLQWNQYKLDNETYLYYDTSEYGSGPIDDPYYWYGYGDIHQLLETDTTEYQLALVFSKHNAHFSPYGGVKLSSWETDYTGYWEYWKTGSDSRQYEYNESGTWMFSSKQSDYLGVFMGIDCKLTETFVISGELRLGDEYSTTVRMGWMF